MSIFFTYKCDFCGYEFTLEQEEQHAEEEYSHYKCKRCKEIFSFKVKSSYWTGSVEKYNPVCPKCESSEYLEKIEISNSILCPKCNNNTRIIKFGTRVNTDELLKKERELL